MSTSPIPPTFPDDSKRIDAELQADWDAYLKS